MKRKLAFLLIFCLIFMTACGSGGHISAPASSDPAASNKTQESNETGNETGNVSEDPAEENISENVTEDNQTEEPDVENTSEEQEENSTIPEENITEEKGDAAYINHRYGFGCILPSDWTGYSRSDSAALMEWDDVVFYAQNVDEDGSGPVLIVSVSKDFAGYSKESLLSSVEEAYTEGTVSTERNTIDFAGEERTFITYESDGYYYGMLVMVYDDASEFCMIMVGGLNEDDPAKILSYFFDTEKTDEEDLNVFDEGPAVFGGTYTNEMFGFRGDFDSNWIIADEATMAELNGLTTQLFEEKGYEDLLDETGSVCDFYAYMLNGNNFNIRVENMNILYGTLLNEDKLAELSRSQLEDTLGGIGYENLQIETGKMMFAGEEHTTIFITGDIEGNKVYQALVLVKKGTNVAYITGTSINSDELEDMFASFSAM